MPIRPRISSTDLQKPKPVPVADNVIAAEPVNTRALDSRGTFDPKADPYPGSTMDKLGVPNGPVALSLARFAAFHSEPILPKQMRVQDLLAQLRMPNDPKSNVERTYRARVRSPLTAIRGWCVLCAGGPKAANLCPNNSCVLWSFRRGRNPFRTRTDGE